jgi:DNA repair protein RadD
VIIDEVHNFSEEDGTTYKNFIQDCMTNNNSCKVLGFTATSYRLKGGSIYGKDRLFKKLIYKIGLRELIDQGHLSPVTSKHGKASSDFSKVKLSAGDFNTKEVNLILNDRILVEKTVKEILKLAEGRQKVLIFCCSIDHAELVKDVLRQEGCAITHSKMEKRFREGNEKEFMNSDIRFMVNVGVLTEGWDCPAVDCIVLLRPTCSPGLYVQMVGRGLRIHDNKDNCLVLDFGGNIERHGCIDMVEQVMEKKEREKISKKADCQMCKTCPECDTLIPLASMECLECGYIFPKKDFNHDTEAADGAIISSEIVDNEKDVDFVMCNLHKKQGSPDSIKVSYWCGMNVYDEWVCLEHSGYAKSKAIHWYQDRHTSLIVPSKVSEINMTELSNRLTQITKSISVRKNGKYFRIIKYTLNYDELKHAEQRSAQ